MTVLVPGTQGQTSQRAFTFIGLKIANIQHLLLCLAHILLASLGPGNGLHLMFSKWVDAVCPRGRYWCSEGAWCSDRHRVGIQVCVCVCVWCRTLRGGCSNCNCSSLLGRATHLGDLPKEVSMVPPLFCIPM